MYASRVQQLYMRLFNVQMYMLHNITNERKKNTERSYLKCVVTRLNKLLYEIQDTCIVCVHVLFVLLICQITKNVYVGVNTIYHFVCFFKLSRERRCRNLSIGPRVGVLFIISVSLMSAKISCVRDFLM